MVVVVRGGLFMRIGRGHGGQEGGVALTGSGWPDIAAGAVIALLFLKSVLGVIGEAWPA
ncbi:hypothetical protein ACQ5SA_00015 [Stenotrophomonas indicatrix]